MPDMPGLVGAAQTAPPTQPQAPPTDPAQAPQPQGETLTASNDVTKDIQKYITKATLLIHSPETSKKIQKMLSQPNPVLQIANLTVMILQRIDAAARASGTEPQDIVKIAAAQAIVGLLCEMGDAMHKFKLNKAFKVLALTAAIEAYYKGEIQAKRIDPAKLKQTAGNNIKMMDPKLLEESRKAAAAIPMIAEQYKQRITQQKGA